MHSLNSDVQCNGRHDGKGTEVVITGISGRYPESDSVEEFKQNLFAGIDLVSEDSRRWTPGKILQTRYQLRYQIRYL